MKIECTVKEFADLVSLLQNRQETKKHNVITRLTLEDETSSTTCQDKSHADSVLSLQNRHKDSKHVGSVKIAFPNCKEISLNV